MGASSQSAVERSVASGFGRSKLKGDNFIKRISHCPAEKNVLEPGHFIPWVISLLLTIFEVMFTAISTNVGGSKCTRVCGFFMNKFIKITYASSVQ